VTLSSRESPSAARRESSSASVSGARIAGRCVAKSCRVGQCVQEDPKAGVTPLGYAFGE
jgi:hypothetical protein